MRREAVSLLSARCFRAQGCERHVGNYVARQNAVSSCRVRLISWTIGEQESEEVAQGNAAHEIRGIE